MRDKTQTTIKSHFVTGLIWGAMLGGAFVALGFAFLSGPFGKAIL